MPLDKVTDKTSAPPEPELPELVPLVPVLPPEPAEAPAVVPIKPLPPPEPLPPASKAFEPVALSDKVSLASRYKTPLIFGGASALSAAAAGFFGVVAGRKEDASHKAVHSSEARAAYNDAEKWADVANVGWGLTAVFTGVATYFLLAPRSDE